MPHCFKTSLPPHTLGWRCNSQISHWKCWNVCFCALARADVELEVVLGRRTWKLPPCLSWVLKELYNQGSVNKYCASLWLWSLRMISFAFNSKSSLRPASYFLPTSFRSLPNPNPIQYPTSRLWESNLHHLWKSWWSEGISGCPLVKRRRSIPTRWITVVRSLSGFPSCPACPTSQI